MPARVTRARVKQPDENIIPESSKKVCLNAKKLTRMPLADRTNSASDGNESGNDMKKIPRSIPTIRPQRTLRVPARLSDHHLAFTPSRKSTQKNVSKNINIPNNEINPSDRKLQNAQTTQVVKTTQVTISTKKTRASVRKEIAGTSQAPSTTKDDNLAQANKSKQPDMPAPPDKPAPPDMLAPPAKSTQNINKTQTRANKTLGAKKLTKENDSVTQQIVARDSSRKQKSTKTVIPVFNKKQERQSIISISPTKEIRSIFKKIASPRTLLTSKKESPEVKEKLAIYEFTYDPSEEPKVPKKKIKKQTVRRKAAPRRIVVKDNYTKNVEKQLESLKRHISKKSDLKDGLTTVPAVKESQKKAIEVSNKLGSHANTKVQSVENDQVCPIEIEHSDQQPDGGPWDEPPLSYSPIPPRQHAESASLDFNPAHDRDPLNLVEELSFFDEVPIASSSILSRKSVGASPWRVNCEVHRKYPVNMYVKSNMTPAYESSFINVDIDCEEKPEKCNLFTDQPETGLKQTSILSFIKEKAEKKKRKAFVTPTKNNSLFDVSHSSTISERLEISPPECVNTTPINSSNPEVTAISVEPRTPEKFKSRLEKNNNKEFKDVDAFFGFNDSGADEDQENISPNKKIQKMIKSKRLLRNRVGLSELNHQKPMRLTTLPSTAIAARAAVVNKIYEDLKSAKESVISPQMDHMEKKGLRCEDSIDNSDDISVEHTNNKENSLSPVPLFEDIEILHHKPERKSYGKTRKVTFQQAATLADESDVEKESDDGDSTFTLTMRKRQNKRKNKKKDEAEKENEEAETWAKQFNSMIEEVDQFPLLIE